MSKLYAKYDASNISKNQFNAQKCAILLEDAQFGALPNLNRYIFLNSGYAANFK